MSRNAARGLVRPRPLLLKVWQMGFRGRACDYQGRPVSFSSAVQLAKGVIDLTTFIRRAEASYIQVLVNAGLPIERSEVAIVLLNDAQQVDYIDGLLDDLVQRGWIKPIRWRLRRSPVRLRACWTRAGRCSRVKCSGRCKPTQVLPFCLNLRQRLS